ncbi:hypothetical protein EJ05DRAFT_497297 [Pseudovirgaria hyperparasitica]|uniref:Uncharacterized protein n=1 Tax=Pseudovirgaria hyperparasitica TaxID=470096 RepID=A0A6A6WD23_9PEZI|nr:uncharacterized protein EJ05DRAFT_497297 [Pseudovirgaria hyperparasitica]KAF2760728.1 hypothetical protein EJ05DRAFT_497297 [Pseudovirgaria hyperparasitica]
MLVPTRCCLARSHLAARARGHHARISILTRRWTSTHSYEGQHQQQQEQEQEQHAQFLTLRQGTPVRTGVDVFMGDPHQALAIVPSDIGFAFRNAVFPLAGGQADGLDTDVDVDVDVGVLPLVFYHDTRHFAHASSALPQLILPRDLPRQRNANATSTSPAALYMYGRSHTFVLTGTEDETFTRHLRDSIRELGPCLEQLKDM